MDEIKVTWRFAWSLWWRMMLITLGIYAVIGIITFIVGAALFPPWDGML